MPRGLGAAAGPAHTPTEHAPAPAAAISGGALTSRPLALFSTTVIAEVAIVPKWEYREGGW